MGKNATPDFVIENRANPAMYLSECPLCMPVERVDPLTGECPCCGCVDPSNLHPFRSYCIDSFYSAQRPVLIMPWSKPPESILSLPTEEARVAAIVAASQMINAGDSFHVRRRDVKTWGCPFYFVQTLDWRRAHDDVRGWISCIVLAGCKLKLFNHA